MKLTPKKHAVFPPSGGGSNKTGCPGDKILLAHILHDRFLIPKITDMQKYSENPDTGHGSYPCRVPTESNSFLSRPPVWHNLVRLSYVFLFAYTGYSKLLDHVPFTKGISRVPVLGHFPEAIGWGTPILELVLALGMVVPERRVQRLSFGLSVILMAIFTLYLLLMVSLVKEKLCHCGGVIGSLGWTEHLVFNVVILALGIWSSGKKNIL